MEFQKTIKKENIIQGVGLHTGNKVDIRFKPAPVNTGINFIRTDLPSQHPIKADIQNILSSLRSQRRTSIGNDNVEIHTIEHLMAVLSAVGIDNILIEINNNEVPGLDGSGVDFLEVLNSCGLEEQPAARKYNILREPIWVEEEDMSIIAIPSSFYRISYTLNYDHPLLKAQYMDILVDQQKFEKEIVSARTFCLEAEAEDLQRQGLGRGANYENTLVVGEKQIIKNRLRFTDEFVRHKILDLIGDLYLLGEPIKAHIIAIRSGHPLNIKLIKKIQQQKERVSLGGVRAGYTPDTTEELDATTIMRILPHRYPFLFVDKIISLEKGKRAVGIKNVTINDNFFVGHFPNRPVMPGVLIIEAMAQVGGILMLSPEENRGKLAYFLAADKVKFRKTVIPGDQLVLEVEVVKLKSKTGQVHTKASVNDKIVAEADLMFALVEG